MKTAPAANVTCTWRTYTGYSHTHEAGKLVDLTDNLPAVLVMPLALWEKAWAVAVLHTAATATEDIDRMLSEAIEQLGTRMLDPAEQARYYLGEDTDHRDPERTPSSVFTDNIRRPGTAPIYFPFREAVAAGYAIFADHTTRENIARLGYPTYDDAIQKIASPPATSNQPPPRTSQMRTPITLATAMADLPETPTQSRQASLFLTIQIDPLSTATDLLVQHDYTIPATAAIAPEDTEPGDIITWNDGTFGLVLEDDTVYSADRGLRLVEDAVADSAFLGAWNISTDWNRPTPKGDIVNPALLKRVKTATDRLLAASEAATAHLGTIISKISPEISDEAKERRRKASTFAAAAQARTTT